MRFRITFAAPSGVDRATAALLIAGQELDAERYEREAGGLVFYGADDAVIIEYAPGVWRSVAAVGALNAALGAAKDQSDNSGRPQAK